MTVEDHSNCTTWDNIICVKHELEGVVNCPGLLLNVDHRCQEIETKIKNVKNVKTCLKQKTFVNIV